MNDDKITHELGNLVKPPMKKRPLLFQTILAIAILTGAIGLSKYYLDSAPKGKPQQHRIIAPLIEVITARLRNVDYQLQAMGTVIADQSIELKPRVQGQLVSVAPQFTPGGFFEAEEIIATIDPQDYKLAIAQIQGEEAKARAELNLELGRQLVAEKEFQLLGKQVSKKEQALMLRTPQLKAAKAALRAIRAREEIAQADLAHTNIRAPFPAIIINKNTDLGSRVTPATTIAQLVGAERFLIRFTLPQSQLRWLSTNPVNPSPVHIYQDGRFSHAGVITHISSALEEGSKMAVVYAKVDDPLSRKKENQGSPQLLLGGFVEVVITGKQLTKVLPVDRSTLDGQNRVWILDEDGRIAARKVEVIARDDRQVYIGSGVNEGELLIVSELPPAGKQRP